MPLIGTVDSTRAAEIMDSLLTGISGQNARVAIMDVTGVKVVDTQVANALIQAAQAARLLGTEASVRPPYAPTEGTPLWPQRDGRHL
jgi:anti-anti-sigma regulatory factor